MAVDDYRKNHWPNLEKAIDLLLIQKPTDHISISYAQIYRWDIEDTWPHSKCYVMYEMRTGKTVKVQYKVTKNNESI